MENRRNLMLAQAEKFENLASGSPNEGCETVFRARSEPALSKPPYRRRDEFDTGARIP